MNRILQSALAIVLAQDAKARIETQWGNGIFSADKWIKVIDPAVC